MSDANNPLAPPAELALAAIRLATGGIGIETLLDAMLAGPEAERDVLAAIGQGVQPNGDPDWADYNDYLVARTKDEPFYTFSGWLRATGRQHGD